MSPNTVPAFRVLLQLIGRNRRVFFTTAALWILVEAAPILPGLLLQRFFNVLQTASATVSGVQWLAALLVGVAASRVLLILMAYFHDSRFRFAVSSRLRSNLFDLLIYRAETTRVKDHFGELLTRLDGDVEGIENAVDWVLDTIGKGIFALLALAILLRVSVAVTLVAYLPIVLISVVALLAGRRLTALRQDNRRAAGAVSALMGEIFRTQEAIQIHSAQPHAVRTLQKQNVERMRVGVREQTFTSSLSAVYQNTVTLGTGLVLLTSAAQLQSGSLTLGDLSLFIYYLSYISGFTEFFGNFLNQYRQTGVAVQRLADLVQDPSGAVLVDTQVAQDAAAHPVLPARGEGALLTVRQLTYEHPGSGRGVRDIDLEVRRGQRIVITGRVGSGKSTLLRGALGLLPAQRGERAWCGVPLTAETLISPPLAAYTPQLPHLLSGTIEENVAMGRHFSADQLAQFATLAVMNEDLAGFPEGWDTQVGERGAKLSGGQVQRTAAARMFARDPSLFVVDDLSSALDAVTEERLWNNLKRLNNAAFLIVSQRRPAFQISDEIIVLDEGRIIDRGVVSELLNRCTLFQQLWYGDSSKS